jgi:hypothetical protein
MTHVHNWQVVSIFVRGFEDVCVDCGQRRTIVNHPWPEWREPVPGRVVVDEQSENPDLRPASVLAGQPKHPVLEEMEK